ncbi:hypothetical protein [Roseburia hominis]|jgi:hypothetical protein|uniref:hypothetical protein n=1 Tax=Roseburia hominis TaxID=301301 RepID=UPI00204B6F65|nr:hypothetical protein [Roseburia hominis]DAL95958.1 MAG TPA: zinc-ribbon containing domain protein [Caudoviricetes sp.]
MTENEAKIFIQNAMEQSKNVLAELMLIMPKVFAAKRKSLGEYYSNLENCKKEIQSCEVAIKALEEVQQYRALETRLAEMFGGELSLEDVTDELERYLKEPDNTHPINAKILTYEDAADWDAYRAIGTPEECQKSVAVCKAMIDRKITPENMEEYMKFEDECVKCGFTLKSLLEAREKQIPYKLSRKKLVWGVGKCKCGVEFLDRQTGFCGNCGQKLDWEGER